MRWLWIVALTPGCSVFLGGDDNGECKPQIQINGPLVEGDGADVAPFGASDADRSPPRLLGLNNCELRGPLTFQADGDRVVAGVSVVGRRSAIIELAVPIDTTLADDEIEVAMTVTDGNGVEVANTSVAVRYLPELIDSTVLSSGEYSFVSLAGAGIPDAEPIRISSRSALIVGAAIDASAAQAVAGPGGFAGGNAGPASGEGAGLAQVDAVACGGGGGGNGTMGSAGSLGSGGPSINDGQLLALDPVGGGGGAGCDNGTTRAIGGGGGGYVELAARGGLVLDAPIIAAGGVPTDEAQATGGAGAGGTILVRGHHIAGASRVLATPGGISSGGGDGGDGRIRIDSVEPFTVDRFETVGECATAGAICAVAAVDFVGTAVRIQGGNNVVEGDQVFEITGELTDPVVTIDDEVTAEPFIVTNRGVFEVCSTMRDASGAVRDNDPVWLARARYCVDLGVVK